MCHYLELGSGEGEGEMEALAVRAGAGAGETTSARRSGVVLAFPLVGYLGWAKKVERSQKSRRLILGLRC